MNGDIDFEGIDIEYSGNKMPALFAERGNLNNAIEDTEYSQLSISLQQLPVVSVYIFQAFTLPYFKYHCFRFADLLPMC